MSYISVKEASKKWGITERVVRQYCADGRIPGAFITGKTWNIPDTAEKPGRKPRRRKAPEDLPGRLIMEKENGISGGIYHKVQIELTPDGSLNVDDILETVNHFRCIDLIIDQAKRPLTEALIKQLHLVLKSGTTDSRKSWFAVGAYKRLANEVGGRETTAPEDVPKKMKELLSDYKKREAVTFEDLLEFHYRFESIHPFQDGNGRVGRLILFKECLRNGIVPFIIEDDMKLYYYRGLHDWRNEQGYLRDTCLAAQDRFKIYLDYYGVKY